MGNPRMIDIDLENLDKRENEIWVHGYLTAVSHVLKFLEKEFPNPTLGIQKVMKRMQELGETK
jgi:hypothetical protein